MSIDVSLKFLSALPQPHHWVTVVRLDGDDDDTYPGGEWQVADNHPAATQDLAVITHRASGSYRFVRRELLPPAQIVDAAGRVGIVTEGRDGGLFARPADVPYIVADSRGVTGVAGAQLITATWWQRQPDGSYVGSWYDSHLNTRLIACGA